MKKGIPVIFLLVFFFHSAFGQTMQDRFVEALQAQDTLLLEEYTEYIETPLDSGMYFYFLSLIRSRLDKNESAVIAAEKAIPYFDLLNSSGYYLATYNQLRYLQSMIGNWERAMFFGQQALKGAEAIQDTSKIAYALADMAVVYHDMEDYNMGVQYAKRGVDLLKSSTDPDYASLVVVTNSLAINFDDWDKPDSALYYHYENLKLLAVIDSSRLTNTFNNIGNTLLKQEMYSEAKKWIEVSLKYNYERNNSYKIATNYTNLANIAHNQNNFARAESMLDSAKKYIDLSSSREKLRDYLWEQYHFQKKKGDLNRAVVYLEEYTELKDSIFKEERVKTIGEIQTRYEVSQKERELAVSRAALVENELVVKNRNYQILLLFVLTLIALGVGFFVYYRQKNRTRHLEQESKLQAILAEQETQNRLLEQRNRISSDLHDNIGAQLTFIVSSLDNLKYVDLSKEKLGKKLDQISSFTIETVNELRDTIWAMNKESISMEDLQLRLNNLIQKAQASCPDVEFHLEIAEKLSIDKKLNSMEGINYYRVAQEAINNAVKHSEATQVSVWLGIENGIVALKVSDNGKGIPEEKTKGNGLGTMRNRAERIGRNLVLNSSAQSGTEVCIL